MSKASRIRELIKSQILSERLPDGTQLLPVRQLAEHYAVSYLTVSHALDQLEQEQLILRVHGRGVFVNYSPKLRNAEKFRVLLIYHAQDAISPLFIDRLFNFFCERHDELTLLESSLLDGLSPEARLEKLMEYLNKPADLLIADGIYNLPFREIDRCRSNFGKIVFFNRYESDFELLNVSRILYDYRAAGRRAGEAFLKRKRRRILYIAPDSSVRRKFPPYGPEVTYHWQMRAGLEESLAGSGAELENLIITPANLSSKLKKSFNDFQPDAVFAFHDYCALKTIQILNADGFRVGKKVDVLGCFNADIGRCWSVPGLSTLNFDTGKILDELKNIISGNVINPSVMIAPDLICRESMREEK